ncbi:MAG: hypothetical protein JWO93_1628, partial [Micrococcaceae bacterium]|nr:hypothetical protein [Micrococcaceae bacterium]
METKDWKPKRWLRIVLPTVLILVWLAAAGFGGPTFGKLSSVSSNEQSTFLPANAESTVAGQWQQKFLDSDAIPALVLLVANQAIAPAQLGAYADLGEKL